jgi:hypothetical protein
MVTVAASINGIIKINNFFLNARIEDIVVFERTGAMLV